MIDPLKHKHILLGVTGSIAAYKAADLASKLAQNGAIVNAILTKAATEFISPMSFQSVTGERAYTDEDLWGHEAHVLHVGLAHKADILVIAPATATTIAKLTHGLADNLLSLTALACGTGKHAVPMIIAPAMDAGMFNHAATQENIRILTERDVIFIGPEEGHLASGLVAKGRLTEPAQILGLIRYWLSRGGPLKGKKFVITAGGTQEEIDPVRFISNHSSGKQGYALAQAAVDAGAEVTLISAPTQLIPPMGVQVIPVRSADQMAEATVSTCQNADILVMAAAVADFRPVQKSTQKMKKSKEMISLQLEATKDILLEIMNNRLHSGYPELVVGFAAETQDLLENAQTKLKAKGLDLIVANDVSMEGSGFGVDTNQVSFLTPTGQPVHLPHMTKNEVAGRVIDEILTLIQSKS